MATEKRPRPRSPDLVLLAIATLLFCAVALAPLPASVRALIAIPYLVVAPGYAFVVAALPHKRTGGWTSEHGAFRESVSSRERLAISFLVSLVLEPLLGLGCSLMGIGITLGSTVGANVIVVVAGGGIALVRRLASAKGADPVISGASGAWAGASTLERSLAVATAFSLVLTAILVGSVVQPAGGAEHYEELYLLGPGGKAGGYPTSLIVGQSFNLTIGVVSHDAGIMRLSLVETQEQGALNGTLFAPIGASANATLAELALHPNERWERNITVALTEPGPHLLRFVLVAAEGRPLQTVSLYVEGISR